MFHRDRVNGVPREHIQALRAVPFFEGLPDKVLARIDSHVDEIDVAQGDVLTAQGHMAHEAFIIEDGVAEVRVDDQVVREAGLGELIGELGVLHNSLRTATVVAKTPMHLLVMNNRDLRWLFEDERLAARVQDNVVRHQRGASD